MSAGMRRAGLLGLIVTVAAWTRIASAADIPTHLAGYRSWKTLTTEAQLVPHELAVQCAPLTPQQLQIARKSHGPHTDRWVKVYANPTALRALRDKAAMTFPPGSVIAKEKLRRPGDVQAEGVAFMIKHPQGAFAESGGWEFLYHPATGARATYDGCAACHRAGGAKDYVFGSHGRESPPR